MPMRDFLTTVLLCLGQIELVAGSRLYQDALPDDAEESFTISYTIPRRVTNPIFINNEKDYEQLLREATGKPPYEVKVFLVQNQVRLQIQYIYAH